MESAKDRILDYALGVHFREEAAADRTEEILAAWQRGERGSGVSTAAAGEALAPPLLVRHRSFHPLLLAASLLLATAVGLFCWQLSGPSPETGHLALASRPVTVLSGPARSAETRDRVRDGDTVVLLAAAPVQLDLVAGGRLTLSNHSALSLSEAQGRTHLELELGVLRVASVAGHALEIGAGLARVRPQQDALLELQRVARLADSAGKVPETAAELLALGALPVQRLEVDVFSGRVELFEGELPVTLFAGESRVVAGKKALPQKTMEARALELLAQMTVPEGWAEMTAKQREQGFKVMSQQAAELAAYVKKDPALWKVLQPAMGEALTSSDLPPSVRSGLADLLLKDGSTPALELIVKAWEFAPDFLSDAQVLLLAEQGVGAFGKELMARVAVPMEFNDQHQIRAAAALAFMGSDGGVRVLERAMEVPSLDRGVVHDTLLAATALAALGREEYWATAMREVDFVVNNALERGQVEYARWMVLKAEFFLEAHRAGKAIGVTDLDQQVDAYNRQREPGLKTPEDIREVLRGLAAE